VSGQTYQLAYDAENQLVNVTKNGTNIASFVYNGDGRRVESDMDGDMILFIGSYYEFNDTTNEVTKYYFGGASVIAVRKYIIPQSQTLNYLLGDHLASTSIVTDDTGSLIMETRYKPWGEVRYTTPNMTLPTRYTFTGQYSDSYINLLWYGSRHYDPALGRFISPDSIVPDPNNPQSYDHYAYTFNNPLRYTDPSGHTPVPWGQIIVFLAVRAWQNGRLTNKDWEDAANTYVPAISPGSKESLSVTASFGAAGIVSATYITTDEGDGELYLEAGGGLATPQLSATATDGQIFGEDFEEASNYEGLASQVFGGFTPEPEPVGIAGEVWGAGDGSDVWGVDAGLSVGVGIPISIGVGGTYAKPADVVLKKIGLLENPGIERFVRQVTYHNWEGPELLVCRAMSMCGR
jgi:RHS repeat-associated protein